MRKTGIPERGFRSRGRATDLKRVRCRGRGGRDFHIKRLTAEPPAAAAVATLSRMAETEGSLDQRLEEIGAQLAWVRDYL